MSTGPLHTIGEYFKSARESKKLSLDEVNRHTKISIRVLEAIEQDDLDAFESDIYLKGFLRTYAGFLNLDSDYVLRTLERQRGSAGVGQGTVWDIEETVREEKLESARIVRRFVLPVLLLIIIILALLLVRERQRVKDAGNDNPREHSVVEKTDYRAA